MVVYALILSNMQEPDWHLLGVFESFDGACEVASRIAGKTLDFKKCERARAGVWVVDSKKDGESLKEVFTIITCALGVTRWS